MAVTVRIPTPLRTLTAEQDTVQADGGTVGAVIDDLQTKHPGLKARICDESGAVRRFVNFYVNDEDIRFKDGTETPVSDGDELSIIPAIAGGSDRVHG